MASDMTRSRRRRIGGLALAAAMLLPAFVVVGPVGDIPEADAQARCIASTNPVQVSCPSRFGGGSPGGGSPDGGDPGGGGGGGPRPACIWQAFDMSQLDREVQEWLAEGHVGGSFEWDEHQWWWKSCQVDGAYYECPATFDVNEEDAGASPSGGDGPTPAGCFDGDDSLPASVTEAPDGVPAPAGVDPDVYLLQVLWRRVREYLTEPELATDPAEERPAIIDKPSFVEVTNWSDSWEGHEQDSVTLPTGVVTVDLWWESSLWFDPGEPDSGEFECDPPGSRHDPEGPPSVEQVTAGTCAHAYQHRTLSGGGHEATVTVNFDFNWESSEGWSGVFDTIPQDTSFTRAVDEVQTVVDEFPDFEEVE